MPPIPATQVSPYPAVDGWPQWLSRRETAEYLREQHGIKFGPAALANAAVKGTGPPFHKDGGKLVSYWRPDVDEWARKRRSRRVNCASEFREQREPEAA
jgi:hypothetical protein